MSADLSPRFLVLSMQEIKCLGLIVNPLLTKFFLTTSVHRLLFPEERKNELGHAVSSHLDVTCRV